MNPAHSLFGTSGIRGDAEKLFTPQFCFDIGRTFAIFLTNNKTDGAVAIGSDPRESSPRIKEDIESGLVYEGRSVFDEGATSVPSICYITHVDDNYAGSIMVSGSHIKAELNGVKFFAFKEEILKKHEKEIEEIYFSIKEKVKPKIDVASITHEDRAKREYKDMLVSLINGGLPSWKVVVDPGNGAQSDTMPDVLRSLGVNVVEENCSIQVNFLARDTENADEFKSLSQRVTQEKADFGVAYDSDGDRAVFIDSKGNFIPGEYTACLVALDFSGDTVVTTMGSSQVVDHIGKIVIRTKVGSPYVVEAMKQNNCKLGFEANGGVISGEIMRTRDGGSTTIKVLNYLKKHKLSLDEAIGSLPKYFLYKTKVDYRWELKDKILEEAKKEFKGEKIEEIDGLKIWLDASTWILFRSSMNAPEFRVFAESDRQENSKDLLKRGVELVERIINE